MRPRAHVVRDVVHQEALHPRGAQHDHVIEALTSDRSDEAFDVGVVTGSVERSRRPGCAWPRSWWRLRRRRNRGRAAGTPDTRVGEGVAELLRRPRRGRVIGDGDVHDASAVVRQDHQHEEQPVRHRRDEVSGHHLPDVVHQKRSPGLRRWRWTTSHVLRDRGLTHGDPGETMRGITDRRLFAGDRNLQ